MAVDPQKLVRSARSLLTSEDTALKLPLTDFFAAIPVAIDEWHSRNRMMALKTGKSRKITATTANITISSGVANCKTAIEAVGILPDKVREAEIFISYAGNPNLAVRFVNSRDRVNLNGVQDKFFINAHFDNEKIFFQNVGGVPLNAVDFTITADSNPTTLANMPEDLFGEIAQILAELMKKFNTDTEHKGVNRRLAQK